MQGLRAPGLKSPMSGQLGALDAESLAVRWTLLAVPFLALDEHLHRSWFEFLQTSAYHAIFMILFVLPLVLTQSREIG